MTDILGEKEYAAIIKAVAKGARHTEEGCFTEDQVQAVVGFVKSAFMQYASARMILTGEMDVVFDGGDMMLVVNEKGNERLAKKFGGKKCQGNA